MSTPKTTFALCLANRGFFPASLMDEAREEIPAVLKELGHDCLLMPKDATRNGAIETPEEGGKFAEFLRQHRGKYSGIILSLPNFGDENGAVAALRDADVPILIQAYPDDLDKMAPEKRRDSFCGKFSVMDVFYQNNIRYTTLKPHTVHPKSERFRDHIRYFDVVCRVVHGLRHMTVGAIGARTTAFKTVRIDELALQRHGITVETLDLSDVFARMAEVKQDTTYREKEAALDRCGSWEHVPAQAKDKLVRLGVVLDRIIEEMNLDAIALRCWLEMQKQLGISPCVLLGELNNRGIAAACEVDVGNAVSMHALRLATYKPPMCLDWNNNYGDDEDKCILFHCGPVAPSLMAAPGTITDHAILANAVGEGKGYGCNVGRIGAGPFTFASMTTSNGQLRFYLGEGTFTKDPIPADFFGCAGVAEIPRLQEVLMHVGRQGYRHHVSAAFGTVAAPVREALEHYLGCDVTLPQEDKLC